MLIIPNRPKTSITIPGMPLDYPFTRIKADPLPKALNLPNYKGTIGHLWKFVMGISETVQISSVGKDAIEVKTLVKVGEHTNQNGQVFERFDYKYYTTLRPEDFPTPVNVNPRELVAINIMAHTENASSLTRSLKTIAVVGSTSIEFDENLAIGLALRASIERPDEDITNIDTINQINNGVLVFNQVITLNSVEETHDIIYRTDPIAFTAWLTAGVGLFMEVRK